MSRTVSLTTLTAMLCTLGVGCFHSDRFDEDLPPATFCSVGESTSCACPEGETGGRALCRSDGSEFGACTGCEPVFSCPAVDPLGGREDGCVGSECTPATLARGELRPQTLALHAGTLWWLNYAGQLKWVSTNGGVAELSFIQVDDPETLVVNDSGIFLLTNLFKDGGGLYQIGVDGVTITQLAAGGGLSLTVVGSVVYWYGTDAQGVNALLSLDLATASRTVRSVTGAGLTLVLVGDEQGIYGTNTVGIFAVNPGETAIDSLVSTGAATGMALGQDHVYWLDKKVHRVPRAGGTVETFGTEVGAASPGLAHPAMAATSDAVYFVAGAGTRECPDDRIYKINLADGKQSVIAQGQARPNGIVVDPEYVYWINEGSTSGAADGAVMRARR